MAKIELPAIRLHDIRHTWATLELQAGEHPKVVQERLGHANVSITLDVYSHVTEHLHGDVASRVAKIIFGSVSTPLAKTGGGGEKPRDKPKHCAGEGSRTPMSFRTDGFEPSAYTIPPPRPGS